MMSYNNIDEKIKKYATNPVDGQEWYFSFAGVCQSIEILLANNFNILGLEGFDKDGQYIIPDMAAILDNSEGSKITMEALQNNFFDKVNNAQKKVWTVVYSK